MVDGGPGSGDPLLGIDLGSANVKAVLCAPDGRLLQTLCVAARGQSRLVLAAALARLLAPPAGPRVLRLGVTGTGDQLLAGLAGVRRVNEVVSTAAAVCAAFPTARTAIDLGGQSSKWILLTAGQDRSGAVLDFATNGLCAAGSGAFIEQQAGRLRLSVDELGRAAAGAARGASIAGRCSAFAKSDMIHLQQKGTPLDEIALGLCQALVRTFVATVMDGRRVEPPVVLTGGGAANAGLVRAFREALGLEPQLLAVLDQPLLAAAVGAALLAADARAVRVSELLAAVGPRGASISFATGEECAAATAATGREFAPLVAVGGPEHQPPSEDPPAVAGTVSACLGVDVGSVSTNLVLLSPGFEVLQGIYLPTRGRPVAALAEGLALIRERFADRLRVLGVGTTGSGRHLAARILGADVARNEITAQMVSARHYVPEVDTILEIGGQDAKYISVRDGKLADFEMNKICAAGTGSFLEEQAERLGIDIVGEFARLALESERPPDLGNRCTVYMDSELARAQERGTSLPDLCAGLAYSVCRNYLEKVVAGRRIGQHVVLQGGTFSNAAVVAACRALLRRPVRVHPYNRISGAIGAALLAAEALEQEPRQTAFRGLEACAGAEISSFECRRCENLCQVNRVTVDRRVVHFGDTCERYSERDHATVRAERPFPELFAEREALFDSFLADCEARHPEGEPIGLLRASLNLEFLPLWAAFLGELGFHPLVSGRSTAGLLESASGGLPAEVCLPIKASAAQARALVASGAAERLFFPAVLECPSRQDDEETHTCLYTQQLADMLRLDLGDHVVTAQFGIENGVLAMIDPTLALADALGRPIDAVARALAAARDVQARFDAARAALGRSALAVEFDRAVVVLGKPYNTHDRFVNLDLARLLDQVGLPAIPWDLLPLDGVRLAERWRSIPWHFNREQLRAAEVVRRDGRLFPILVSNYGCGPDAFVVKHHEELFAGRPRLLLEFDEHRGEAGLITRLEALADEIEAHLGDPGPRSSGAVTPGSTRRPRGRRFFVPNFAAHARVYAGLLRSAGLEAKVLPPVDDATIRLGEQHASGRECHPFGVLAGELCRLVETRGVRQTDVFLAPSCATSCLLRQYGDGFRLLGERLGMTIEIWDAASRDLRQLVGMAGVSRLYEGLLAADILLTLATRLRPYTDSPAAFDRLFDDGIDGVVFALEQRRKMHPALLAAATELWEWPRNGDPGDRPLVGVTGDVYTRINESGNAGLFRRLEELGCEVWPSPAFAAMSDLDVAMSARRELRRVLVSDLLGTGLTRAVTTSIRRRLLRALPAAVCAVATEPPAETFLELGGRYVGSRTNYLVYHGVGKIADFLSRGADGVVNAAAVNCMVGTAIAAAVPALRADFDHAPVVNLVYGGAESPSQRLRLETFAHQVLERHRAAAAKR